MQCNTRAQVVKMIPREWKTAVDIKTIQSILTLISPMLSHPSVLALQTAILDMCERCLVNPARSAE
eukprot:7753836-Karenia_brevis.AAC.1